MNLYHVWIDDTGDYIAVEAGSPDSLKEITKATKESYLKYKKRTPTTPKVGGEMNFCQQLTAKPCL